MADIAKIAEDLSNLTVLEAAELATMLEEKWGVSAAVLHGSGDAYWWRPAGLEMKRLNLTLS